MGILHKDIENVWYIYGWSDNVLRYIAHAISNGTEQVDLVNKIELFFSKKDEPKPTPVKRSMKRAAKKSIVKKNVTRSRKSKD